MDLFNKKRPKFYYANRDAQAERVNHSLAISFFAFYSLVIVIALTDAAKGKNTFLAAIITCVLAILAMVNGYITNRREPDSYRYRVLSFLWLYAVTIATNVFFDSYYLKFLMMVPLVGYIFYYDHKFIKSSCLLLGTTVVLITLIRIFVGYFGGDMALAADNLAASVTVFLLAIMIIVMENVGAKFNEDMLGELEEKQESQKEILKDILQVAGDVREGTESAMHVVNDLSSATGEVTEGVQNIAHSTHSTADSIQEQTVMTQNIQNAIAATLAHSGSMNEIAMKTKELNQTSGDIMHQMVDQAAAISETNASVSSAMHRLQDRANAVQGIADTIFSISSQTNLLALNASIEAARAGDAGRGFAVVADEIRELADNTREETENIARILNELSINAESAANAVKKSAGATGAQEELIGQVSHSYEQIRLNVDELTQNIENIESMLQGLSESNHQIVESISQLSAFTEEVTASSAEAENLSNENLAHAAEARDRLSSVLEVSRKLDQYMDTEGV